MSINGVEPKSLMLFTKFECHRPAGFREEDFFNIPYMGMKAIQVIV